jgi:hypothetical protein
MINELNTHFQQNFTMRSYKVGIDVLGVDRKFVKDVVHSYKRFFLIKKYIFLHTSCPNSKRSKFGLLVFRIKNLKYF